MCGSSVFKIKIRTRCNFPVLDFSIFLGIRIHDFGFSRICCKIRMIPNLQALESETKVKQVYVPAYNRKTSKVTAQQVSEPSFSPFLSCFLCIKCFPLCAQGHIMVLGKDCDAYPSLTKYSWSQFKKYSRYHFTMVSDPFSLLYIPVQNQFIIPRVKVGILSLGIRIFDKKIIEISFVLFFLQFAIERGGGGRTAGKCATQEVSTDHVKFVSGEG
jgi:hypothetical protein